MELSNQFNMNDDKKLHLYLVLIRALESTPFKELADRIREELAKNINDIRIDYLGQKHARDLSNLLARYPSLNFSSILLEQASKEWLQRGVVVKRYQAKSLISRLQTRRYHGYLPITKTIPTELYSRYNLHRRIMGHLSPVYCVCFDQTGQYIFTGADDHLIKIWSARDGRLLKTLRGHDGHICDMSVNYENRLLASAGSDRIIRIWDLKTSKLLECLTAHQAMLTSIKFAPYNRHGSDRYLISTANDGTIVFWAYHVEQFGFKKLRKFKERSAPKGQITCSSFSTGGSFLACGSSDNFIHVYGFHPDIGPYWMCELREHNGKVDSVQFCNHGFRFISGSKDGDAIIWTYKGDLWSPLKLNTRDLIDPNFQRRESKSRGGSQPLPTVLIVQWSRDDRYVMISLVDHSIRVWDSFNGQLIHTLKEHRHDIYLLESHPIDPRIFVSASHDGSIIVWDIIRGKSLKRIWNLEDPKQAPIAANVSSIYDIKFSPDGNMLAATDSHGYLSIYGTGSSEAYKQIPTEMFFHTDYRPVIRDLRHFVMDENTHIAPHLMPKPILVDMNGNPHPQRYQKLVPDYNLGERVVIPPLSSMQLKNISSVIESHSRQEDEEYLAQKKDLDHYSDSDTIVDSDATEIDDDYIEMDSRPSGSLPDQHNLRSRSYGNPRSSRDRDGERDRDRERERESHRERDRARDRDRERDRDRDRDRNEEIELGRQRRRCSARLRTIRKRPRLS